MGVATNGAYRCRSDVSTVTQPSTGGKLKYGSKRTVFTDRTGAVWTTEFNVHRESDGQSRSAGQPDRDGLGRRLESMPNVGLTCHG